MVVCDWHPISDQKTGTERVIHLNSCSGARAKTESPRVPVEGSLRHTVQESRKEEEQGQCGETLLCGPQSQACLLPHSPVPGRWPDSTALLVSPPVSKLCFQSHVHEPVCMYPKHTSFCLSSHTDVHAIYGGHVGFVPPVPRASVLPAKPSAL